jgi:3alpha(or 20beta)-hydroxysteroid dehydrogenase
MVSNDFHNRLRDKVALITGGARGMGEAAARRLHAEGAKVVLADILEAEGKSVADELGEAARFVRLDVTNPEQWAEAVAFAEREFGRLDVLVNNAGILSFGALTEVELTEYRRIIEVNQVGVFLGMQVAVPALERAGGGSIVNLSSVEGLGGGPFLVAYTASKFAVRGMTKAAAIELGPKAIRVNSVHPGAIRTDMVLSQTGGDPGAEKWMAKKVALKRMGEPSEVAALVAFLASDDSSYCTGAEFVVDGGATASSGFN